MRDLIKELTRNRDHELNQIGLTPRTTFMGMQQDHDTHHKNKANQYETAIEILRNNSERW